MLRTSVISFPGLGIGEFSVNSVAFTIFGMDIAWYAIIITCGMIAAVVYATLMANKIGITTEDVLDYAIWTIPIGIIGARLYYVLCELDNYHTLLDVINIREGGLAIYGGIIGGALAVLGVSYYKKINFLAFADCVMPGVILAQAIGRWGNFMNGEAFGGVTDIFCRMGLKNVLTGGTMMYVHPTFFYESFWNIVGFVLVNLYIKYIHKKYDGQIFIMLCGWYGFGRMFIELLRTDSLYLGNTGIRISSLLGGIIFAVCLGFIIYFEIKKPSKPLYHKVSAPSANTNKTKTKKGKK